MIQPNAAQTPAHRSNNFDSLRFLAAVGVVISHSVPLTYGPHWPLTPSAFFDIVGALGGIAVQIFFIISGYLITASYLNTKNPRRFIRARFLRLVPALLAVLWLLAFGLGPFLTTLPLRDYFHSLLPYRAAFGLSDHLPGVFTHNPFSSGIDGSLWTLRYEALCYLAVLLLGLAGQLRRLPITGLFVILLAARLYFGNIPALDLGTIFAAGAVIYVWQPKLTAGFAVPCAMLWLLSMQFGFSTLASDTIFAYLVIYLGLAPGFKLPNFAKYGDFSYGIYIYAWPIQQTIASRLHVGWLANIAITLPIVLVLAFLSWHFIENPMLQLKNKKLFGII
jgi:peptidoglycan/LPS O-acetylase OafA/YrhL